MSKHFHAVVWIDHHEARVFYFDAEDAERLVVHPAHAAQHIHHKANSVGSGHAQVDPKYLGEVTKAIAAAGAVLIAGPANAKHELVKFIEAHEPALRARVYGVETLDHPTEGQLLAHARQYFRGADRMGPSAEAI